MNNINKIREFIYKQGGLPTQLSVMLYTAYVRNLKESAYPAWCTINGRLSEKIRHNTRDHIKGVGG